MGAATFYTIANARYFPGLVALLNSLRLTGHDQELVVLDEGLTPEQRARLDPLVRLVELPEERLGHPALAKPYPHLLDPTGVVTLIDSDIIVTRSLAPALADAAPERSRRTGTTRTTEWRWFAEWEEDVQLSGPPRRQTYVNAGFVAFSQERWPAFLTRWREACARIPLDRFGVAPRWQPRVTAIEREPFWAGDQDALNAILMAEIARRHSRSSPSTRSPTGSTRWRSSTGQTLACLYRGKPASLLHFSLAPKPWAPNGWKRVRRNAYVELLPRLLFARRPALRLDPQEVVPLASSRPGRNPHARRPRWAEPRPGGHRASLAWRRARSAPVRTAAAPRAARPDRPAATLTARW